MLDSITNFIQDESGQGIIEYAGCLAFVAGLLVTLSHWNTPGTMGPFLKQIFYVDIPNAVAAMLSS